MELKATMKMYHDELEEAVSELFGIQTLDRAPLTEIPIVHMSLLPHEALVLNRRTSQKSDVILRMRFIIRKMKNGNLQLYLR